MSSRAERRRILHHERRRRRRGTGGPRGRRWFVVLGVLAVAVVAVVIYLLWPSVKGAPVLAFDKLRVDLGTVPRNQDGTQTFLVMNRGKGPLTVGPVRLEVVEGCDQVTTPASTLEVAPGKMERLTINLGRHRKLGPHRVRAYVPSNDLERPVAELSVRFVVEEEEAYQGTGPRLRVDKELIDIGVVPYDWPLYEEFTLRNDGDAPLVLKGVPVVRFEEGC